MTGMNHKNYVRTSKKFAMMMMMIMIVFIIEDFRL